MPRTSFTWNPKGLERCSFKNFKWVPNPASGRNQLIAGVITAVFVLLGSALNALLPIPNINLLAYVVIAFFMADRVHPHPLIGPTIVTLSLVGVSFALYMTVPDTLPLPASFLLTVTANLFVSMTLGAILATVFKTEK